MISKRMKEIILSSQEESMIKQRQLFDELFENWKGKFDQLGDVCIIELKI